MRIDVLKNELRVAFKNLYILEDLFENWLPLNNEKKFDHHLIVPK